MRHAIVRKNGHVDIWQMEIPITGELVVKFLFYANELPNIDEQVIKDIELIRQRELTRAILVRKNPGLA